VSVDEARKTAADCQDATQRLNNLVDSEVRRMADTVGKVDGIGEQTEEHEAAISEMRSTLRIGRKRLDAVHAEHRAEVERLVAKLNDLDSYLRETFHRNLHGAMATFDRTVCDVLQEMKGELLHGVSRIEHMEAAVAKRHELGDRILQDGEAAHRMIEGTPDAEEDEDASTDTADDAEAASAPTEGVTDTEEAKPQDGAPEPDEANREEGETPDDGPKPETDDREDDDPPEDSADGTDEKEEKLPPEISDDDVEIQVLPL
jgi:hypothetical protein